MAHNYFSIVPNVREMYAKYPKEIMLLSCDSEAKYTLVVRQFHHQVRTFFPADDMLHYEDLRPQYNNQMPVTIKDKLGRNVMEVRVIDMQDMQRVRSGETDLLHL